MNDFEYYDKEPKKSRKGFFAVAILIIAIAIAGAIIVQYIVPELAAKTTLAELANTSTPMPTTSTPEMVTQVPKAAQTIEKVITYIESGSIPDIVEQVSPAIVGVMNYVEISGGSGFGQTAQPREVPQATGSGVIISKDGYIVTNHHVIDGATRVTVTLTNGAEHNAQIVGSDKYVDLAVLKIEVDNLQFMSFGNSEHARTGELAIAIGYPLSRDFSSITVTAGILSAVGRDVEVDGIHFEMLQTDAPINPGNSGGALVDGAGQLIGINTLKTLYAGSTDFGTTIAAEGIGYAIPSHVVEPIVKDLIEEGEVVRPFVGIAGRIVTQADSEYYNIPQGLYVDEVTENGPAQKAGILAGDIITHVNDEKIIVFQDIFIAITTSNIGDELKFIVFRADSDEIIEYTVILESSKDY